MKHLDGNCSEVESFYGGVHGDNCLKINLADNDTVKVEQKIYPAESGSYVLKGMIKHSKSDPNSEITYGTIKLRAHGTYTRDEEVEVSVGSSSGASSTEIRPIQHFHESKFYGVGDKGWYQFTGNTSTIPSDAYNISMFVEIIATSNQCELFVDELQLTLVDQSNRTNLVGNGYMQFVEDNLPEGWLFDNDETVDEIVQVSSSDEHSPILGGNVMRFAPGDVADSGTSSQFSVKKMYQDLNIKGLSGESLVFSVFAKAYASFNNKFRAYLRFDYINQTSYTHYFEFDRNFSKWQMLTRSITAQYDYSSVTIGIEYSGGNEAMFDAIQLYRDSFGKFYNYDARGNITESMDAGGASLSAAYNEDNQVVSIIAQDGSSFRYDYDTSNRIKTVKDLSGNKVAFTYDVDGNVSTTKLTSSDQEEIILSTTYDSKGNPLTQTDEHNNITSHAFDYLNRVTQVTLPNGLSMDYEYNDYSELEKVYSILNSTTHQNDIQHDSKGQVLQSQNSNGTKYNYEYDNWGRLKKVKSNDSVLNELYYGETINGINKGLVSNKKYGASGDTYTFEYDDKDRVSIVKLNYVGIVEYFYNDNNQIVHVKDLRNGIFKHFDYDMRGNLLKVTTEDEGQISYTYDNLGSMQKVTYDINGFTRSFDFEYHYLVYFQNLFYSDAYHYPSMLDVNDCSLFARSE